MSAVSSVTYLEKFVLTINSDHALEKMSDEELLLFLKLNGSRFTLKEIRRYMTWIYPSLSESYIQKYRDMGKYQCT